MASSYLQVSINVFTGLENQAFKYSVWEAEDSILFLRCGNRCDVSGPCGGPANGGVLRLPELPRQGPAQIEGPRQALTMTFMSQCALLKTKKIPLWTESNASLPC